MPDRESFWDALEGRAKQSPQALLAVDEADRELRFGAYLAQVERYAAYLAAKGVGAGTPVSWMLPNWLESFVVCGALIRLGAVQNPILPIYRDREVSFVTAQCQAQWLLVPGTWRGFDYAAMAHNIALAQPGLSVEVIEKELPEGDASQLPPPPPLTTPDDSPVRWVFYTSGTTSVPKGARHSDATLFATTRGLCDVLDVRSDDRNSLAFPFTHIGGVSWLLASALVGCAQIVLEAWHPERSIEVLARHGVTLAGSGTAFHQAYLAKQRQTPGVPIFPEVRCCPGGAAPKPPQLHYDLKNELGGVGIVSGYGLTECPILAMNRTTDPDEKLAHTEGRASPKGMQIRVVTLDGREAGPGEEGEIRALGPQLCKGYLDESLNEAAFDPRGFFCTGDLGYLDEDGFIVITGRLKDVIIRKGENISAKEVEDALYPHPKVADVAVIGLPDPASGERCCAVVACEDASDPLTFDEMSSYLREQGLMVQKLPEQLEIVDEVPRNPTGKILKHELRKRYGGE